MQEVVHFPQIEGDSPKLRKVEAIVQHFSQQFQEYYVPEQQVSIEASLIDFECRVGDLQPNICQTSITTDLDSSCHVYAKFQLATCIDMACMALYEVTNKNCSEYGLSHDICVDLMQPLLDMGYHLFTDNWYTAVPLVEFLSSRNTNIAGTVRASRKFLPAGVKENLPKGDSIAFRKNNLLCIGWHGKNHAIILSTKGSSKMITYIYNQTKLRKHHARISE